MRTTREFPFDTARRITAKEVRLARRAIEGVTGHKRNPRGRPPKAKDLKYQPVSIRLHPKVLLWARKKAKKQGVGYQTVINEYLLNKVA